MAQSHATYRDLGADDVLEELLDRFESAWRGGSPPLIEEYLSAAEPVSDPAVRVSLVEELVKVDLEYRWRQAGGSPGATLADSGGLPPRPKLEDYAARLSALGTPGGLRVELIGEEYRVRRRWGDLPSHAEYAARFPDRGEPLATELAAVDAALAAEAPTEAPADHNRPRVCPQCHSPMGPIAEPSPADFVCPECRASFVNLPTGPLGAILESDTVAPLSHVGRYVLGERLGSGGFGSVWRAYDTELKRDVAVKIPRGGWLAPADIERFFREARSAARLRHPGVVAVHDAGREGDTVYIVSELVHGMTLGEWHERNRLGFREVAEVAAQVAEALDDAHRNGIVHRDLKPSNILIQAEDAKRGGVGFRARVVDFGLAKHDSGEITMTVDGQTLGTPAYMSPEQFLNPHAVDGRSDVYSLGIVLYQLLTDVLPFRGVARMIQLQVVQDDPCPPRRINDRIPRDLETVTLRCLAKDPGRRYATARDLADDLCRFLRGEPVQARPVGRLERWANLCRRNRLATGLAASLFVAIAAGLIGVAWQVVQVERQRELADQGFHDALRVVDDYLTTVSESVLLNRPGLEPLRGELLGRALTYYQTFIGRRAHDAVATAELADAYAAVGKITAATGSEFEALAAFDKALATFEALNARDPSSRRYLLGLAQAQNNRGEQQMRTGHAGEARSSFEKAIESLLILDRARPVAIEVRRDLAGAYRNLGVLFDVTGRPTEARTHLERASSLFEDLVRSNPGDPRHRGELARTLVNLGVHHHEAGRLDQALGPYQQARDLEENLVHERPDVPSYRSDLANTCSNLGSLLRALDRAPEAETQYRRALELQEVLVRDHPAVSAYRTELGRTLNNLGRLQHVTGHPQDAIVTHQRAIALREDLVRQNPDDWEARSLLASSLDNLGLSLVEVGQPGEAVTTLRRALAELNASLPASTYVQQVRNLAMQDLALALRKAGRVEESAEVVLDRMSRCGEDPRELYNAACELALCVPLASGTDATRFADEAMSALRRAVRVGFRNALHAKNDPDLESLRVRPDFQMLIMDLSLPDHPFVQ
jgi:serine/threonine-protein kinase